MTCLAAPGLLAGVILSWPLWNESAREAFPLLPLAGEVRQPDVGGMPGLLAAGLLVILLFGAVVFCQKKIATGLLLSAIILFCVLDINRLQPWVWFYLLILSAVFFGRKEMEHQTVQALQWVLAGVYFWSGFSKITPYFADDNFPWFCEAFAFTHSLGANPWAGYGIVILEMLFGIGLLFPRTRLFFRWTVVVFHGIIIAFLVKLDWNWVVIPWNMAMAAMVWVVFAGPGKTGYSSGVFTFRSNGAQTLVVGLATVAPLFSWLGLWPAALSWHLYSNTQPEATFVSEKKRLPDSIQSDPVWNKYAFDDGSKMLIDDWANDELKVPMFASPEAFRRMGTYLCSRFGADSTGLYILTVNPWDKSKEKMEKTECGGVSE